MADIDEIESGDIGANGSDETPQVGIIAQYVKDLSFENPRAPQIFQTEGQPQLNVSINVNATRVSDDVYEVILRIAAQAETDGQTSFAVELLYGGLFGLRNVPEGALQPFLLVEAPRLIFPFARRIVADATRDGGFPPLLLEPIDFAALYLAQTENGQAQAPTGSGIGNA